MNVFIQVRTNLAAPLDVKYLKYKDVFKIESKGSGLVFISYYIWYKDSHMEPSYTEHTDNILEDNIIEMKVTL